MRRRFPFLMLVNEKLSILIVDDHRELLGLLRSILEKTYRVVGEAENGEIGLTSFRELHPDVVILDVSMPGMNGFQAAQFMFKVCPRAQIVFCSEHSRPEYVRYAMSLGALGYLSKADILQKLPPLLSKALPGTWSSVL